MLEGLEALLALERCGTVSEAAVSLRLTQSAVSKRIQSLQNDVGFRLTEPDGRRVRLTNEARNYIEQARPLYLELQGLSGKTAKPGPSTISIAMADSIASSWGPQILGKVLELSPHLNLQLHAHRSALVIESVRLGRYQVGLCTLPLKLNDLVSVPVFSEPFVLLNARLNSKLDKKLPLITIEPGSATWSAIATQVGSVPDLKGHEYIRVESFSAALQMAISGFGNALLPLGLVKTMPLKNSSYRLLPSLHREIALITRKTISQQEGFQQLADQTKKLCKELLSRSGQ